MLKRQQKYIICKNFNYLTVTVHEIQPDDKRTDNDNDKFLTKKKTRRHQFSRILLLKSTPRIITLGLSISTGCQYHDHLVSKTKLASKKLGVIGKAGQYFTPKHLLALYRSQVRPHHLWAGDSFNHI